jgi:hypothetical protein
MKSIQQTDLLVCVRTYCQSFFFRFTGNTELQEAAMSLALAASGWQRLSACGLSQ